MTDHIFKGRWISDDVLANVAPRNVFHRQLQPIDLPQDENSNSHVLFRRKLTLHKRPTKATVYISADDYYKLYIGGRFVAQGPAPAYHFRYNYNEIDVTEYLVEGENTIAVHTYYQGLINRVWQSGDGRHGLILDLVCDGETVLCSDESFLTHRHTAYSPMGIVGIQTQYMERYDSRAAEVGFESPNFDDSSWESATPHRHDDHTLMPQRSPMLVYETVEPTLVEQRGKVLFVDFGAMYVGTMTATACGHSGEVIEIRSGQELCEDGSVRDNLRCLGRGRYVEEWILSGKVDRLNQFDFKAFRYAEFECGDDVEIADIRLLVRHAPFTLKQNLHPDYACDEQVRRIWDLCVRSQEYGVQETVQDCMDREKGFYLGDGCYSVFANYVLTGDDSMLRKMIDDAFASSFIAGGLVTCMDCSFMQEIAEYPLMLPDLMLWHYRMGGDKDYLRANYPKMCSVLDFYRDSYETNGLLRDLDRWCVVEWPANYRDGYEVEITEGKVCHEAHIAINAYYYRAITSLNEIARLLGLAPYREAEALRQVILDTFYDAERHLFVDGEDHKHVSLVGNVFPYAFELAPDKQFEENFKQMLIDKGEDQTFFFTSLALLCKYTRDRDTESIRRLLLHNGTWSRMLREDATTTFEGWGKDCKWNTSLFHLTMSAVVMFLCDTDLSDIFA